MTRGRGEGSGDVRPVLFQTRLRCAIEVHIRCLVTKFDHTFPVRRDPGTVLR